MPKFHLFLLDISLFYYLLTFYCNQCYNQFVISVTDGKGGNLSGIDRREQKYSKLSAYADRLGSPVG